jgi:hypothetical protein
MQPQPKGALFSPRARHTANFAASFLQMDTQSAAGDDFSVLFVRNSGMLPCYFACFGYSSLGL